MYNSYFFFIVASVKTVIRVICQNSHLQKDWVQGKWIHAFYKVINAKWTWSVSLSIIHTSWLTERNSFLLLLPSRQFGTYRRAVSPSSHLQKDQIQEKRIYAFYKVIISKYTWSLYLSIIHTSRLTKGVTAFYCCFRQSSLGEDNDLLKVLTYKRTEFRENGFMSFTRSWV